MVCCAKYNLSITSWNAQQDIPQSSIQIASKNKPSHRQTQEAKTLRELHQRKDWRWDMRNEVKWWSSLASPPALTNNGWQKDTGKKERLKERKKKRKKEGAKETGCGGDSRDREVVPVWREKALCFWSVDRPVKLRRAQGHRPEGFTGLCSFLCGSSVSTSAATDPPAPAWCPLWVQLHDWL